MTVTAPREWPPAILLAARLASFAFIGSVLYLAQVVLIPMALAMLVTFLMTPLVTRLDRWGLPRLLAVIVVTGSVTGLIGGLGYVVVGEVGKLAEELPEYRENIRAKLGDLRNLTRGGTLESVQRTVAEITADVERDTAAEQAADDAVEVEAGRREPAPAEAEPVRVQVERDRELMTDAALLGPVLTTAATLGLTMLLSIFMLLKREDLRNRILSLAGQASLVVTTKAMTEAGERITRYLLMQFLLNASMGLAVGIGLFFIGVPYAALWGLSAAVLRYIPYVGPWVGALLPITVSLITAPGWEQVVIVISLFVILELISNNVMEPWLYGQSVGLSPVAVIVSAVFWTWLWGPVGLVLAMPMTAVLVVLARYIPDLAVFDRLLSERPALRPHLWLYQRLLSRDEDEAAAIVAAYRARHSLNETCNELLFGTLLALNHDRVAGRLKSEDGDFIATTLREIVDDLGLESSEESRPAKVHEGTRLRLIGFPVRDKLDELALQLLAVTLREEHCDLEILPSQMLLGERIAVVEARAPAAVCIPSLPPGGLTATRHVCKRLRTRFPELNLIVGRFGDPEVPARSRQLLREAGARQVVSTMKELGDILRQLVRDARPAPGSFGRDASGSDIVKDHAAPGAVALR
jgi:predicted PurR-regulated permease PerM